MPLHRQSRVFVEQNESTVLPRRRGGGHARGPHRRRAAEPGRIEDGIVLGLAGPRDRAAPAVEAAARRVLAALDRSLKPVQKRPDDAAAGAAWW